MGTDIKGARRSRRSLLEAAGYGSREGEFDEVLQCLDRDVRLIRGVEDSEDLEDQGTEKHYQLTHDYLVRSIREWIRRKQKETRRGRAELCLEDRAEQYARAAEARFLPTPLEYITYVRFASVYRSFKDINQFMGELKDLLQK